MKRSLTAGIPAARSRYPITATVSSSTREAQSRSIRASGPCSAGAPHAAVTRVTVAHQSPVKVVPDLSLVHAASGDDVSREAARCSAGPVRAHQDRRRTVQRKKIQGFTFVELIVVVAVAAILMGTAVPSFTSLMNSNRLATQANDLLGAIMIARSEAIRLNRRVILCSSDDGVNCATATSRWNGWLVFADNDRDDVPDSGEVLRTGTISPATVMVQGSSRISGQGNRIRMGADGLVRAATGSSAALLQARLSVCIVGTAPQQNTREIRIGANSQAQIVAVDNSGTCPVPSNA